MKYYHLQTTSPYGKGRKSSPSLPSNEAMVSSNEPQGRFRLHPYYPPPFCADIRMPHSPIPSPWACDFCNTATFGTFEEASAHEQVCAMNRQRILNTTTAVLNVPTKVDGKRVLLLSMPCDRESLSDRQCYVRSHFVEVFTATESDVASR